MKKIKLYSVVFVVIAGLVLVQVNMAEALKLAIVKPADKNDPDSPLVIKKIIDFKNKDEAPNGRIFAPLSPSMPINLNSSYNPAALTITLSWDPSHDIDGDDAAIVYEVYQTDGSPVLLGTVSTTGYSLSVSEVGRSYSFRVIAVDSDGLKSPANAIVVDVPSYLTDVFFYENPAVAGKQKIELRWDTYPFVQKYVVDSGPDGNYRVALFYLNQEPAPPPSLTGALGDAWGNMLNTGIKISYRDCTTFFTVGASLILPDSAARCTAGGGVRNLAFNYANIGTDRLRVDVDSLALAAPPTIQDYITVAFYAFSGGDSQKLVAIDKTKYYFQFSAPAP